ncbi:MAG: hypothetical protein J6D47_07290 [Peptostreptococcaceae bacterium]|nr:hypothetical protein [Peptostreptococcaceae bacterium]
MITKLNRLIEEFKGCFMTDSAPDMLKAAKLLDEIERLSSATGQRENIMKELYDFAATLTESDKMKLTVTNYNNATVIKVPTRVPADTLEYILNEVRPAYIERFKDICYTDTKDAIIIRYRGLKDIGIEFKFEITEGELLEYLKFLDQLFS